MLFSLGLFEAQGQVKIGDNAEDISPFAILELESTNRRLLLPKMTTEQWDQAFDQTAPEGIMIFNMDRQAMQVFYYPEIRVTGKKAVNKIWTESEEETFSGVVPDFPKPGDLYYNTDTNSLFAWNPIRNLWMPINSDTVGGGGGGGSASTTRVTDPSVTRSGTII